MINTEKERELFERWYLSTGGNIERKKSHYANTETNVAWMGWKVRAKIALVDSEDQNKQLKKYAEKYGSTIGRIHALGKKIARFNGILWVNANVSKPSHNGKVMIITDDGDSELGFCDEHGTFRNYPYGEKIKYAMYLSDIPLYEKH